MVIHNKWDLHNCFRLKKTSNSASRMSDIVHWCLALTLTRAEECLTLNSSEDYLVGIWYIEQKKLP